MLIGNVGIISILGSFVISFVGKDENHLPWYWKMGILIGAVLILWLLSNSRIIDRWLRFAIHKGLRKYTKLNVRDYVGLLHLSGDYTISEMKVRDNDWLCDKTLLELELRKEGINVIGIEKEGNTYIGSPKGETKIENGDLLIVYGRESVIEDLNQRKRNIKGKIRHKEIIEEQKEIRQKEEKEVENEQEKRKDLL